MLCHVRRWHLAPTSLRLTPVGHVSALNPTSFGVTRIGAPAGVW